MGFRSLRPLLRDIHHCNDSHEKPHSKSPRKKACELTKRKERKKR